MQGAMTSRREPVRDWARVQRGGTGVDLLEAAFEHHVYDRHSHDTLAIGVTLRGVQRFWCRGSTHDSRPGDVIVIDPGDVHDGRSGSHGGYGYRMLYLDPVAVRTIVEDAVEGAVGSVTTQAPLLHNPSLAKEINAAWKALAQDPGSLEANERLDRVIRHLSAPGRQQDVPRPSVNQKALHRVRDHLHDRIDHAVTTDDLAGVAGLSRFQLTRQFQRVFGLPLHAYHLQIRLEEARRRLRRGDPIATVAADLGFVDQSHFHRRFRARFGVTPAGWRRTAIQDA